jgi:hypothetical protein
VRFEQRDRTARGATTGPSYQVPFVETVRRGGKITLQAVGMIADPQQAEAIIAEGRPDYVAFARAFLDGPALHPWHAANTLGAASPARRNIIAAAPISDRVPRSPTRTAAPAIDHTPHSIVRENPRRKDRHSDGVSDYRARSQIRDQAVSLSRVT